MREQNLLIGFAIVPFFLFLNACSSDNSSNPIAGACTPVGHVMTQRTAAQSSRLVAHVPEVVSQLSDRGKVSEDRLIPITVALKLNNEDDLDQRLAEIYQPGNPKFHHFLATGEFKARYAPTDKQIEDAKMFLLSHGIQSAEADSTGYFIHASGSVAAMNEAFQTEIHRYTDADGNEYFAPSVEPTMPDGLSIRAVHGLHNVSHLQKHLATAAVIPSYGSGPNGGMSPADIRNAYSIPSTADGSGQVMALVEFDGYTASDITNYERGFGLSSVQLENIHVDGASGKPGAGADEVTLDIELMVAMAPGASKIMVYEAPNSLQAVLDVYAKIANDNQAKIVSTSWGSAESAVSQTFLESENVIFKQMAAQGQSLFAATGDHGAYDTESGSPSVDDPASQPYVVAVGGTHLNESGGRYISETSWDDGSPSAGGGGGGVSSVWSQPTWQNGVANSSNGSSSSMRNTPDVSLNADPNTGYSIFLNGYWTVFGGTSASTPLWAAFMALVNQQRVNVGLEILGFANPYLYAIGRGARFGADFRDIGDGSTNMYYRAVPGYDDSTGWGTIDGNGLFQDLSADPVITPDLSC